MKKLLLLLFACLWLIMATAQTNHKKELFAFTITDYMVDVDAGIKLVQVQLPENFKGLIVTAQAAILKHNDVNVNDDTAKVGWGKCSLIKGNYYYFALHLYDKQNVPLKNDLIYTFVNYPAAYKGRIYGLVKNAIYFKHVTEEQFYDFSTLALLDEKKENSLVDSLAADIKYTGKEMLQQNDGQDQDITTGIFTGKKLFAAMQIVTANNVKDFIDYVIARPQNYAGNSWKIAETFATWMVAGTPMVIKE
jgi:hypothetical protein